MTQSLDLEEKEKIISELNVRIGNDINDLSGAHKAESEFAARRKHLECCLNTANNEVPTKLSTAIKKAEENSQQIVKLKERRDKLQAKVADFLKRTDPLRTELDKRYTAINKLEEVLNYVKSFERIEDLCRQLKQCNDDEQSVVIYGELKEMCNQYKGGHRATYAKEYTHYWHNVLKDKLTRDYDEVLKLLKWPFASGVENSPPPKEIILKFSNLTKYLFLIQEPEDLISSTITDEFYQGQDPCLPVRLLLRPLKKRFTFHFTGTRQTARVDRPEWFLTQTLTWIRDHQNFVKTHVQPVADKLKLKKVKTVDEFNAGLIALAAERLHTVLAIYHTQGAKGEIVDVDAAFAHAVDETLGFHKELVVITGKESDSVLSVLTRAETFIRWLAVEKKYALAKMDETLGSEQWSEPVAAGVGAAVGAAVWVPRAADWLVSLLSTIEQRYSMLPQPGHRLQFLELQLELIEEWRVRLTQLLSAALADDADWTALAAVINSAHHTRTTLLQWAHSLIELLSAALADDADWTALAAVINSAHHTRTTLLQWAHSLHYLQLHYYRRQFQHFTHRQHHDESESSSSDSESDSKADGTSEEDNNLCPVSLEELEETAQKMAAEVMAKRSSLDPRATTPEPFREFDDTMQTVMTTIANLRVAEPLQDEDTEAAGVWAEAPALLAHLRDAGLTAMADRILLEFKAALRDYKKQNWHGMLIAEEMALSVSGALCGPLSAMVTRVGLACSLLAPPLAARLRAALAHSSDTFILEEVVLENWFNTGGTIQLTHDVKRNLVPAFAPPGNQATQACQLPKLVDACKLLNLDYEDARKLKALLAKQPVNAVGALIERGVRHIKPAEALQILNQSYLVYEDARKLKALLAKQPVNAVGALIERGVRHIKPAEALQILNQSYLVYEDARKLKALLAKQPVNAVGALIERGVRHIKPAEALQILNQSYLDYKDARKLKALLAKQPVNAVGALIERGVRHIKPAEALQILNQSYLYYEVARKLKALLAKQPVNAVGALIERGVRHIKPAEALQILNQSYLGLRRHNGNTILDSLAILLQILNQRLVTTCQLLNLDYEDARKLKALLAKQPVNAVGALIERGVRHIKPAEALQILNQSYLVYEDARKLKALLAKQPVNAVGALIERGVRHIKPAEALQILNQSYLVYEDARKLKALLAKQPVNAVGALIERGVRHIKPAEALQILNQRTDLADASAPSSVMDLF
ncbi:RINT-1 / TIP-1 family domain-containing protein [Phthorimaea operculella]|nr:RINT-1 / TIP-1 family domain-containing protein [Phthorimaea operculella]